MFVCHVQTNIIHKDPEETILQKYNNTITIGVSFRASEAREESLEVQQYEVIAQCKKSLEGFLTLRVRNDTLSYH